MFRDDYTNEMNNIRPDADTERAILERLENGDAHERKRRASNSKIIWRVGTVAVACAVAAVAIILPTRNNGIRTVQEKNSDVFQVRSYDDIYETINQIYNGTNESKNGFTDFIATFTTGWAAKNSDAEMATGYDDVDEEFEYEYEYSATDDGSAENTSSSTTVTTDTLSDDATADGDYTSTNTQVEGVDEADIVKTDGKYIYALYSNQVRIIRADNGKMELVNTLKLYASGYGSWSEMYLSSDRLCIISNANQVGNSQILIIDISDPADAKQIGICSQNGDYEDSRLIGNSLYLISNYHVQKNEVDKDKPETYVPCVSDSQKEITVSPDSIRIYDCDDLYAVYTVICGYDITDASLISTQSILGRSDSVYCSTQNLLTARECGYDDETQLNYTVITRFSIEKGKIEYVTDNRIDGTLLNQFSMDENSGYFRFVTTVSSLTEKSYSAESASSSVGSSTVTDTVFIQTAADTTTSLYVLDAELKLTGSIENLAPGERVYSVRFMGDTAYFVTFRETDPLFSADLSDPENPKILGQLKIPGFSNFLFPYGNGQLLGLGMEADEKTGATECVKLSMFDISDPVNVTEHSKYLIEDSYYSHALYNHKASLIDPKRNLIGFECDTANGYYYRIYSCENGFSLLTEFYLGASTRYLARAIAIGDVLYLIEDNCAGAYSLNGFTQLHSVRF